MKCLCKDVGFGEYTNTVVMIMPFGNKEVSIDVCIATEMAYLWHQGVETLNSCCGHNKLEPTVIVTEKTISKMRELGYKNSNENCANPEMTFALKGIENLKPLPTNKMYNLKYDK